MKDGWGRNRIARELGISGSSVTKIAADAGHVFDATQTEVAVRAAQIDNAKMREQLAKVALLRAMDAADAMDSPTELVHFQPATEAEPGGWHTYTLDAPSFSDQRNLATIFGIMVTKAGELSRATAAAGDQSTISFVEALAEQMKQAAQLARDGDDTDPTVEPTHVSKDSLLDEYQDADGHDDVP